MTPKEKKEKNDRSMVEKNGHSISHKTQSDVKKGNTKTVRIRKFLNMQLSSLINYDCNLLYLTTAYSFKIETECMRVS